MASIGLEQVTKRFADDVLAVDAVDLSIADGELMVLIGPSGCGKSTILRLMAGLERLTAGTIRIGDRVVNDLAPGDRDVAMVFQDYALYPHLTVYGNIAFALRPTVKSRRELDARDAGLATGQPAPAPARHRRGGTRRCAPQPEGRLLFSNHVSTSCWASR